MSAHTTIGFLSVLRVLSSVIFVPFMGCLVAAEETCKDADSGTRTLPSAPARITLSDGMIIDGVRDDGGYIKWKGIPYAEPPIGDLRWKSPLPYSKGAFMIIDGSQFGNDCIAKGPPGPPPAANGGPTGGGRGPPPGMEGFQPGGGQLPGDGGGGGGGGGGRKLNGILGGASGGGVLSTVSRHRKLQPAKSEDCLFLNIYARDKMCENLPVMLWIHGGGFQFGAGSEYDGTAILAASKHDVIIVTINYRVNMFGFLASEELAQKNELNLGLQDQHAAFMWVKDHIASFGGDPNRITAFGESAGAISITAHLMHYSKEDLGFQAAIIQSGGYPSFIHGDLRTIKSSKPIFDKLADGVGCISSDDVVACMRTKSVEELYAVQLPELRGGVPPFALSKGGDFYKELPMDQLCNGNITVVPTIIGLCTVEGILFVGDAVSDAASFYAFIKAGYPDLSESQIQQILDTYDAAEFNGGAQRAASTAQGDIMFNCASKYFTEVMVEKLPESIYSYRFAYEGREGTPATHADDIQFTWPSERVTNNAAAHELSLALIDYWTAFAVHHKPIRSTIISSERGIQAAAVAAMKSTWAPVNEDYTQLVFQAPAAEMVFEPIVTEDEKQRCSFVLQMDKEETFASL